MKSVYHIFERQGAGVAHAGVRIELSPELALKRWLANCAKAEAPAVAASAPQDQWQYLVRCGGERDEHYHYAVCANN